MAYETSLITQLTLDPTLQPLLPFLFVLAVIYGMLTIANIFKTRSGGSMRSVNFIIALVFAFLAAGYQPFVSFFFANFGIILWAFIILFFIAFILEAIGLRRKKVPPGKEHIPIFTVAIIILILAASGFAYISELEIPVIGTENFLIILGLILILILFYYAYEHGRANVVEDYIKEKMKGR